MIKSMTAFARAEAGNETAMVTCELRSVNHRYLELGFKMPEDFRQLEPEMRKRISSVLERGKVIGLISIGDLVKAIIDDQSFVIEQLENYIAGEKLVH